MDTNALKKFAAAARNLLIDQVSAKLDLVLAEGAPARREHPQAIKDLENAIKRESKKQIIEQVAYTWFNRFTALRFMDANGYTQVRVVSPAEGATRPEILSEAMAGNLPDGAPAEIAALLEGRTPSHDPQAEAYRLLLVYACNTWHKPMPFLFEELDDYSELLMPEDLLSQTSILARLREVMTEDACRDVEIIGWLYQFYISEKKDQVFAGLKRNVKITAENIPAATQLFTPHWIVRYLVENSLGRLWLLNRPGSRLAERMDYYIAPEEPETDFLKITRPEEIRICDPAAGSGHMLTYAFDLLHAIYEEEGYDATEIPALILTHNLTGVEIDDRAGALAAFALMMKAADKLGRRRFLRMEAKPDICVLQPSGVTLDEVWQIWAGLPTSFDDCVADLRSGFRNLPAFTDEVLQALDNVHGRLDGASSAGAIMALSGSFEAALESSIAFLDELASRPKIAKEYSGIAQSLWGAVVNRHSWDDVERTLKAFKKNTGATETTRRLEEIMLRLMKSTGPSETEMNALSHFQSRLKYASGQTETAVLFRERIDNLRVSMRICLELLADVRQFEQAKNFGSLIVPKLRDPAETLRMVEARDFGSDLLLKDLQARVVAVLRMAEALSPKYHVVVANPPYMDISGGNPALKNWANGTFPNSSINLYSMFMERGLALSLNRGVLAMINMQAWMFLKSFEGLRADILSKHSLLSMAHIGENGFDSISGDVVSTTAFVVQSQSPKDKKSEFVRLTQGQNEAAKVTLFEEAKHKNSPHLKFVTDYASFTGITGSPLAYWTSHELRDVFRKCPPLKNFANPRKGMVTADNPRFIRFWHEMRDEKIGWASHSREAAKESGKKWFPYLKGGPFRRWYGNVDSVVNWENDGAELLNMKGNGYKVGSTNHNLEFIFKPAISWTKITSGLVSFRSTGHGFLFDDASGLCPISLPEQQTSFAALLNSPVVYSAIGALNPTLNVYSGTLAELPVELPDRVGDNAESCINLARADWDAFETSWDFTTLPLLVETHRGETLAESYATLRAHWQSMTDEMQALEEENNRIFIDAYGLQDELTPEVPIEEITLTCNPAYRYGVKGTEDDRETRLRADTMAEFLSYAVGCMFGRYSLDAPGLILANQGERLEDYLARIPEPSFMPDADNVIPVLDGDWFADDITERFRLFLRVTLGEAHFRENLRYVEESLGKDIRKYFTKDFYADHVKRYKKRPIYWMFSSPKGTFNALIYMHRYRADTVSVLLNDYLREFINKLEGERARLEKLADDATATQGQRTKALKEAGVVAKQIDELNDWEREVIFPLAQQKIEIDLDDGVKANYPKFGTALKKIVGLS